MFDWSIVIVIILLKYFLFLFYFSHYTYTFLKNAFDKLLKCINDGDYNQVYALADALHNVPIFLSDGCKNLKKALRIEFSYYDKKYGTDLRKELFR